MQYLLSARNLYNNNTLVNTLETKFLDLIRKSNDFISNGLNGQIDRLLSQQDVYTKSESDMEISKNSGHRKNELLLDDDFFLTDQDCEYIDSLSVPRANKDNNSSKLSNSIEPQSNILSIRKSNCSSGFKTPAADTLFKVPLNASIPTFNIDIDNGYVGDVNRIGLQGRPLRERKFADIKKSPYVDRFTSIHGKVFKKEETDLWEWLHSDNRHLR